MMSLPTPVTGSPEHLLSSEAAGKYSRPGGRGIMYNTIDTGRRKPAVVIIKFVLAQVNGFRGVKN